MSKNHRGPSGVDEILGPGGVLSRALPSYESRPEQLQLARAVDQALCREQSLLAEAGTGTGKTLAYLIPAALSGRRVVISTATRALQEQVFFKDLPILETIGLKASHALLKGRANYLCLTRYAQFDAQPLFEFPEDAAHWPAFHNWARTTATGDRAETQLPDSSSIWNKVSTPSEHCAGGRCPEYERCWVTKARHVASEAHLVVVNHALFFADLSLKMRAATLAERRKARGKEDSDLSLSVLPEYDAVIFDEAHAVEDVATEHFGSAVSSARMVMLSQDTVRAGQLKVESAGLLATLGLSLRERTEDFFKFVTRHLELREGRGDARISPESLGPLQKASAPLIETATALAAFCERVSTESSDATRATLEGLKRRAQDVVDATSFILEPSHGTHVHWASHRGRSVWLRAAPIDVGPSLSTWLYKQTKTIIFTSATLATAKGSGAFHFVKKQLGLKPDTESVRVNSPFNYQKQCGLYVPRHVPEPADPTFTESVSDEVERLCKMTEGRAFVLFTSLKQMEHVYAAVSPRLPVPSLLQGERPKRALLDEFIKTPSVLFASQSFWEGVDVAGEALSLVIIDKLPFAPPTEPLTQARIEAMNARGENSFETHQLPRAALALRQGFGRLIRSKSDFGIVAVLDSRLWTKRYGRTFIDALPPATPLSTFEEVEAFWARKNNA